MCRALLDASVVMRLGGLVYLRPDTVAELVVQVHKVDFLRFRAQGFRIPQCPTMSTDGVWDDVCDVNTLTPIMCTSGKHALPLQ